MTTNQIHLYNALLIIPSGKVTTYKSLGKYLSLHPRVVGMILHRNPLPDIYPCYKVVGTDGRLTGFALGLEEKIKRLNADGIPVIDGKIPKDFLRFYE